MTLRDRDRYQVVMIDNEMYLLITMGPVLTRADARRAWDWDFDESLHELNQGE